MNVEDEVDYKKVETKKPKYRFKKLTPEGGISDFTFSETANSTTSFKIPSSDVYNLAKSTLGFDIACDAEVAKYVGQVTAGCLPCIKHIELRTQSNEFLCRLTDAPRYLKVASLTDTPIDEFLSSPPQTGFARCNGTAANAGRCSVLTDSAGNLATRRDGVSVNYTEPAAYVTSSGLNTDLNFTYTIPMKFFRNTIFELDKDLFFNTELILTITWNSANNFSFSANDVVLTQQAILDTLPYVENLYFYLSVQRNQEIVNEIKAEVMDKGLNILFDYVHPYVKTYAGNETNHDLTYRFDKSKGQFLKRIYTSPYFESVNTRTGYVNNQRNRAGLAIMTFNTSLNDERLQDWKVLSDANGCEDEYLILREKLSGSAVQSVTQYEANYFWVDSWDDLKFIEKKPNEENGLDLHKKDYKWQLNATTEGNRVWHTYAVCSRILKITRDKVMIE